MTELENLKMNDEYIKQNDIVKRYLHNKLTPEETVEFEEYILDKPELLEQLELDMVLVENLARVEVAEEQKPEKNKLKPSFLQLLFGTPIKASLGTGFAFAIAAVLIFPFLKSQTLNLGGNIEIFYLSNVRSDTYEQKFKVAQSADTLIFVLEADFEQPELFKVKLRNQTTGLFVPLLPNYLPSEVGEIYVSINAQEMTKGKYLFEYYPVDNRDRKQTLSLSID